MIVSFVFFLNVKLCQLAYTQDEARFGIWQIKTTLKQNEAFWKHGHIVISASQTTVCGGNFLHNGYTEMKFNE